MFGGMNGDVALAHAAVKRLNDCDRMAEFGQGARQVSGNVCESAGLGESHDFRAGEQNVERGGSGGHRFKVSERTGQERMPGDGRESSIVILGLP